MTVDRQVGVTIDKCDGNLRVEMDEELVQSNTPRRYTFQRQVTNAMEITRWEAETGVSEQQYSSYTTSMRLYLNNPSVEMDENTENENIEGVGLHTF